MKVCFYITNMAGGGAEGVFLNLINYLSEKNVTVELVLNRKKGPYLELLKTDISIHELDVDHAKNSIWELTKYLDKSNPDIAVSTLSHCNYALILARLFSKVRLKILVREANSFLAHRKELSKINLFFERLKAGLLYRLADGIFVNSRGSKKELAKAICIKESRIDIVPNPLDLRYIRKKAEENLSEKVIDFLKGKPYIVAAGRLEKAKGFDILIKAFSKIKNGEYRLIILGEGSERKKLEKLAGRFELNEKIMIPGHAKNPYPIMKNAELFVLSSRHEGMPNVLLEALALGIPIVATNCPNGPSELLEGGLFGSLVPVDDEVELAKSMEKQLNGDVSAKKSRRAYIQEFDVENVGSAFLSMLKRLTG